MVPVKKKTKIAILIASLAVFALVLAAALLLSRGAGSDRVQSGEHPLRISEYMSANTAYPNADGRICDWIEIHNTSDKPFNVSGYRLSDDVTQAKYAFPVGTVIPADGYIVVYCDPETSGGLYAPFSLRRLGGETLLLMNSANTVLDEIETLRCRKNTSIVRETDGSFTVSAAPTPGYANTDEGYTAYLAASGQGTGALRLSEIMAAETLFTAPNGALCDWVEIENTGLRDRRSLRYAPHRQGGRGALHVPGGNAARAGRVHGRLVLRRRDGGRRLRRHPARQGRRECHSDRRRRQCA